MMIHPGKSVYCSGLTVALSIIMVMTCVHLILSCLSLSRWQALPELQHRLKKKKKNWIQNVIFFLSVPGNVWSSASPASLPSLWSGRRLTHHCEQPNKTIHSQGWNRWFQLWFRAWRWCYVLTALLCICHRKRWFSWFVAWLSLTIQY